MSIIAETVIHHASPTIRKHRISGTVALLGPQGGGVVTIDVCVDIQVTRTTQVTIIVAIGPTIDAWCSR